MIERINSMDRQQMMDLITSTDRYRQQMMDLITSTDRYRQQMTERINSMDRQQTGRIGFFGNHLSFDAGT